MVQAVVPDLAEASEDIVVDTDVAVSVDIGQAFSTLGACSSWVMSASLPGWSASEVVKQGSDVLPTVRLVVRQLCSLQGLGRRPSAVTEEPVAVRLEAGNGEVPEAKQFWRMSRNMKGYWQRMRRPPASSMTRLTIVCGTQSLLLNCLMASG